MTQAPDDALLRPLLQSIRHGVAVADPDTLQIQFENAAFFAWFRPVGEAVETLAHRLAGCPVAHGLVRLREGRPFLHHTEVRDGARMLSLAVELRLEEIAGRMLLIAEVQDASKQKEAEYMLDSYSKLAERHSRDLHREKERVERLLLNVMPRSVYEELKEFGAATPQRFAQASVLVLGFAGFSAMAERREPAAMVAELNEIFSAFDRIAEMQGCEPIKTLGDTYLAVAGVPQADSGHAAEIAQAALRMRRYVERRNASHPIPWHCRMGLHTGPVIGSIVGVQKYVYDVFGPTVDVAATLMGRAAPMQILLSAETAARLQDGFACLPNGPVEIEGQGPVATASLIDEAPSPGC
jgi:class 3 adenylate cyclase